MEDDLKPCPFCGNLPQIKHDKIGGHHFWYVECEKNEDCPVMISTSDFKTKEEAIQTWNTRKYC